MNMQGNKNGYFRNNESHFFNVFIENIFKKSTLYILIFLSFITIIQFSPLKGYIYFFLIQRIHIQENTTSSRLDRTKSLSGDISYNPLPKKVHTSAIGRVPIRVPSKKSECLIGLNAKAIFTRKPQTGICLIRITEDMPFLLIRSLIFTVLFTR